MTGNDKPEHIPTIKMNEESDGGPRITASLSGADGKVLRSITQEVRPYELKDAREFAQTGTGPYADKIKLPSLD